MGHKDTEICTDDVRDGICRGKLEKLKARGTVDVSVDKRKVLHYR